MLLFLEILELIYVLIKFKLILIKQSKIDKQINKIL
jgi:hypothetical protein